MKPDIASGRVEDLLAAIAKPHIEHDLQGQTAANFDTSVRDEMQGQQRTDPMQSQDYYLRPDETLRPQQPLVDHGGGGGLPPQNPPQGPDELLPIVTTVEGLGRKP